MTGILNEESGLLDMLKRHEGVRSKVYVCSGGYETIGVGRNISETGLGLDDREINYLLGNDILRVRKELEDEYPWFVRMDSVRQDALIDISFNLGQTVLRKFKNALKAMAKKQYEEAANEFMDSRWSQQVGNRALEVTSMIRSGEYQRVRAEAEDQRLEVRVREEDSWQATILIASLTAILIVKVALESLWVKAEIIAEQVSVAAPLGTKAVNKGLLTCHLHMKGNHKTMKGHGFRLEAMPKEV